MKLVNALWILWVMVVGLTGCDAYDPTASTQSIELVKVSGGGKDLTILTEADRHDSLVVKVLDRQGRGVGGVAVTWTQSDPDGQIEPLATVTTEDGTASARWTVAGLPVLHLAKATIAGRLPVEFTFQVRSHDLARVEGRCALTDDGHLACAQAESERLHLVSSTLVFTELIYYPRHTNPEMASSYCALDSDGALWCAPDPPGVPVFSQHHAGQPALRTVAANDGVFCGISLNGELWCWGSTRFGLRADGVGGSSFTHRPDARHVDVQGMGPLVSVRLAWRFGCGLGADGSVWCWGLNDYGTVSTEPGTGGQVLPPTRIATPENATAIALAGDGVACAIGASGRVFCWGIAQFAGRNTITGTATPGYVESAERFTSLAGVPSGFVGVTRDGHVVRWGSLVAGSTMLLRTPIPLQLGENVTFEAALPQRRSHLPLCLRATGSRGTVCVDWAIDMWYEPPPLFRWTGIAEPL